MFAQEYILISRLGILIATLVSISISLLGCASKSISDKEALERGVKIGRYIGSTKGSQQLLYMILDHCNATFSEGNYVISRAKEVWNKRNLFIIDKQREVIRNWLIADGVSSSRILSLLQLIDGQTSTTLAEMKPMQEKALDTFTSKSPEENAKNCILFATFVIGGGRDLQRIAPESIKIFEKFSPVAPNE